MKSVANAFRVFAVGFKGIAAIVGILTLVVALGYLVNEFAYLSSISSPNFNDIITLVGILSAALSGVLLVTLLPGAMRVHIRRPPKLEAVTQTYGFGSLLAIGIGATLGSPLFVLIPLNIVQYEFVSIGSLVLATILSILMAKVYAEMYTESRARGLESLGGPSFTKVACGVRSVRYFVARLSMWVSNTALAAYSKIVFVVFDLEVMPQILSSFGVKGFDSLLIVYVLAGVFVGWAIFSALYERRFLRTVGYLQIFLTVVMVVILVYQSYLFGSAGNWNITGLLRFNGGGNWLAALVINTGYLYLLFFGFQEIQALERDAISESSIPIVSWIFRKYRMSKPSFMGLAMILSVVIAAAVNILYAISVYALHPDPTALGQAQIPALYLTSTVLGPVQELLTAVAFLIATITTFVPAFLAASRHLSALAEDGYVPHSFTSISWIFTLVAIFILAVGNEDFLVNVTDFLVLISLGLICLSAIWLRRSGLHGLIRKDFLPLIVGISCFVAGGAVYFVSSSVAVFGSLSIAIAYLIYDVFELGLIGTQLFLGILGLVAFVVVESYPHLFSVQSFILFQWLNISGTDTTLLPGFLLISSLLLFGNFLVDLYPKFAARNRSFWPNRH